MHIHHRSKLRLSRSVVCLVVLVALALFDQPDLLATSEVFVESLPEVVERTVPDYPPAAACARLRGTVLMQVLVGKDGAAADIRVVKSVPGLDEAAIACARRWRFKPAIANNRPVRAWVEVPLQFPPVIATTDSGAVTMLPTDVVLGPDAPSVIVPPRVLHRTAAARPASSAPTTRADTVVVVALIGESCGAAQEVRVVESVPGLDEAALDCVRRWTFEPARLDGTPIAVWVEVGVGFPPAPEAP